MKAVILAGGYGTRISEETQSRPKPMVEIGGKPLLWHIMKIYSHYGVKDFVICLGFKGYVIKEYFANYCLHTSDVTFDLLSNQLITHERNTEDWRVTLVDTGQETQTGGRLKRVARYLHESEPFCMTYGDGVGDVDVAKLLEFHSGHGRMATVTATTAPGRFGALRMQGTQVEGFQEKPSGMGPGSTADSSYCRRGFEVHRRRCDGVGAGSTGAARGRRGVGGVQARRVLATHGHAAREEPIGGAVGERERALEGLGMNRRMIE
jgi:glucose-1-phosphate cytidylyltransferase